MNSAMSPDEARAYCARKNLSRTTSVVSPDTLAALDSSNLDEVERAYVATVMSVMTHPGFKHVRERVRNGEIALAIEFDEVTWVDADQASEALARVATPPTTETQDTIRRLIMEASAASAALANVASRLESTIQRPGQSEPTNAVVSLVCAEWGLKPAEIHSKRRSRPVAEARHAIIVLLSRMGIPDSRIGLLVDRDQSTLCFARRVVRRRLTTDPKFCARFTRVSGLVAGNSPLTPTAQEVP